VTNPSPWWPNESLPISVTLGLGLRPGFPFLGLWGRGAVRRPGPHSQHQGTWGCTEAVSTGQKEWVGAGATALSFCQCRAMVSGSRGHRVLQKHTVIASQQGGCDLGVRATEHLALPEPARGPWTAARRAAGHVWGEVGPLAGVGAGREIGTRVPEREAMRARVGRNPAEGLEWPRRHYTDVK
jgi:hypothetical protein